MVGSRGFEPPTSSSRTRRANQAALRADNERGNKAEDFTQNQRLFLAFSVIELTAVIYGLHCQCSTVLVYV